MRLGIQQSQKGIEPGAETYFQNGDFGSFQMVQPGFDKDMARLLHGAVHGMVVFVHFGDKERMASIRRQLQFPFDMIRCVLHIFL